MRPCSHTLRQFWMVAFMAIHVHFLPSQTIFPIPNSPVPNFNPRFELFDLPDGDNVQCIVQDSTGFVWFASQTGLYRYDGQHIITYRNDRNDSTSIASNYIEWIFLDKNNVLWLGYPGHGISIFDPSTGRCRHFKNGPKNPYSLSDNNVYMITEDREGFIWVATGHGLNRLNQKTGKFTRFFSNESDARSLSYDLVSSVYLDKQGTLWVGCGMPWDPNDPKDELGGLNRYNGDGTFTRFLHNPKDPESLADNRVRALFEDSRGNFWVGTAGTGLHLMNRKNGTFDRLPFDPKNPSRLGSPLLQRNKTALPQNYHIGFISEDKDGRLWIGANEGGLNIYDPSTERMRHFEAAYGVADSLQTKTLWTFCQTRDGVIWLGCGNGSWNVFRVKPDNQFFPFFDTRQLGWKNLNLTGMVPDGNAGFWMQTTGDFTGVLHFNPQKNEWKKFTYEPPVENKQFLDFFELTFSPDGNLWASTEKGIYKLDPRHNDGIFRPDSMISKAIDFPFLWPPFFDLNGNIWIGSFGNGVYRFDAGWKHLTHFKHDPANPNSLGGDQVEKVLEDRQGHIWITGGSIGVQEDHPLFFDRFDPERNYFDHFVPPGEMGDPTKVVEDLQGNFWFTTFPYGLRKVSPETRQYESFDLASGSVPTNMLTEMQMDKEGIIWMLSSQDIIKLEPETEKFFTYTTRHGVQPVSFTWVVSSCTSPDGAVIFGGQNGFHLFYPEEVSRKAYEIPPYIRLTDFKVKGTSVVPGQSSPLRIPIWEASEIRLPHDQNVFSFSLTNFDFNGEALSRLEFMLENYDESWRHDLHDGEATYVNVPPGEYILKVRGTNSLGAWSAERAAIRIIISPPWWRTWWAYLLYAALAFGIVYFFYKTQLNRRLEHAETLRLRELDAFKTNLYTNITHEFRTPLTVISGMADQVKENPKEWFSEGLKMIKRNSTRLLDLVNQMLDLSKLDSGKLALHYQQGNVVVFLKYLVESFHSLAAGKGVQMHFLSDFDEIMMDFDAERLQQAISNLLANAVKFTPPGGNVYLRISTDDFRLERPAGKIVNPPSQIVIRVTDTGIGIPEEHLPHIFDRFYQVEESAVSSSRTNSTGGTGIGLALSKELINLMDGEISVKSATGKGTEFVITLPVRRQADLRMTNDDLRLDKAPAIENPNSSIENRPSSTDKPLVLIAEDNPDVVTYLASCLAAGYLLSVANDGQECVDIAIERIPDLIVTDVMMPNKDGFEVCEMLKNDERTSHIPIVMLTAKADMESRLAGLRRGADAYLAKPFHKEELLVEIKKLLGLRQKLQQHYRTSAGLGGEATVARDVPKPDAMEDYFVKKARKIVETHLDDSKFSVEELSHEILLSHSQLHRKLSALTGFSATSFIRQIRLKKAKELLLNPELSITAIAYDTGFNDPSYFSRVFKQEFGMTPAEWREQQTTRRH